MEIFEKYDLNKLFGDIMKFLQDFMSKLQEFVADFTFIKNYEDPSWVEENDTY